MQSYLDTANGGTSDWWLSPYAGENEVDCNASYCKVTCTVYRLLSNDDSVNDIQFPANDSFQTVSGFRVWDTRVTTSDQVGFN